MRLSTRFYNGKEREICAQFLFFSLVSTVPPRSFPKWDEMYTLIRRFIKTQQGLKNMKRIIDKKIRKKVISKSDFTVIIVYRTFNLYVLLLSTLVLFTFSYSCYKNIWSIFLVLLNLRENLIYRLIICILIYNYKII